MKLYTLPKDLRNTLRNMHELMENSIVIVGSCKEAANKIKLIIGSAIIWAIGDVVCSTLMKYGPMPKVCVFDERTLREPSHEPIDISKFSKVLEVLNPRGTISEDTLNKLKNITKVKGNVAVKVVGEEDLVALAALIMADIDSYIVYGLPGRGVALIPVTSNNKEVARRLLSRFKVVKI